MPNYSTVFAVVLNKAGAGASAANLGTSSDIRATIIGTASTGQALAALVTTTVKNPYVPGVGIATGVLGAADSADRIKNSIDKNSAMSRV